jgi:LysM repeat protein
MALESFSDKNLKIYPEHDPINPIRTESDGSITVPFNPTTYSISKSLSWSRAGGSNDRRTNAPTLSFGGGSSRQLSLELFFDSTEKPKAECDVRLQTDRIVRLTHILRHLTDPRPPQCRIEWGGPGADFPFIGIVSKLDQQFLLFNADGKPLRAVLKVEFMEFLELSIDQKKTDPELTTRVVRRGDSLPSIAAQVYANPAAWRAIARANRIENPLAIPPGTKLTLPKQ